MKNMKRNLFFAAVAVAAVTACSDQLAESPPVVNSPMAEAETQEIPIMFGSAGTASKGSTRADITGAEAADLLNKKFVVSGYKGSSTASVGSIVFDNYAVEYEENTANTTESNTRNWEYVGVQRIKWAIDRGITSQAMKYWDYSKPQYDFIAWSTGKKKAIFDRPSGGIPDGSVLVSAITPEKAFGDATAAGSTVRAYSFEGKAADLMGCYVADIVTVKKNKYGDDPVTIKFRSLGSKVRMGIYETIPGYSVRSVEFYDKAKGNLPSDPSKPRLFTTESNDIYTEGEYIVYYPTVDSPDKPDNNQAHIFFKGTGSQSTKVAFSGLNLFIAEEGEKTEGASFLGRSSNAASMAGEAEGNYYTQYLPNENGTNLNLRVNYTLESIDGSGETIEVKGATAQVPSRYTQWKAGYAYTYLFKISDRTNGFTGEYDPTNPEGSSTDSNPAGLYPITFDAVVVNDENQDKSQETITLISTPSITTYQNGSGVTDNNEYLASAGDIYVTVGEGGSLQNLNGKAALYSLSNDKVYTETDVIDALTWKYADGTNTINGRNGLVLTEEDFTLTNKVEKGVDGNPITVGDKKAAKFTPEAAKTYAFVYTQTEPAGTATILQPITIGGDKHYGESAAGYYRYNYLPGSGDVQKDKVYFSKSTGLKEVFYGQTVNNLYVNTGTAASPVYTPASGYAVTGTTYYYTTNKGLSYKEAANIAYAEFKDAELYTTADNGQTYSAKTDDDAVSGVAYYQKQGSNYVYCVILPEQAGNADPKKVLLVLDTTQQVPCADNEKFIPGQTYFVCYYKNNGVYYTKVIKVE